MGRLKIGDGRQIMGKYISVLITAVVVLSTIAAADNALSQKIHQSAEGEMASDGSNWFQNAGMGSLVLGESDILDQIIAQDLNGNSGVVFQDTNLTSIITGNENKVFQETRQSAFDNEIDSLLAEDSPVQKNNEIAIIIGNKSSANQSVSQTINGTKVSNSLLSQIAFETTTVIGRGSSASQEINQDFFNKTLINNGKVNQTSSLRSTVVGLADESDEPSGNVTG
jgi:hypothetical protein